MPNQEAPRLSLSATVKENLSILIVLAVMLVVTAQTVTRLSSLEKHVATSDAKVNRLEDWMITNGQLAGERHTETMKSLTSLLASTNYIVEYYRRADSERR